MEATKWNYKLQQQAAAVRARWNKINATNKAAVRATWNKINATNTAAVIIIILLYGHTV